MYYAFDRRWLNSTVTVALVIINILVFLAEQVTGDTLYALGVLDVNRVLVHHEYNRLVSAMFMHDGISHLFSNMILLFYVGAAVERNLGHILYTILYLGSGIIGNALTILYETSQRESWTSLGASGAVFGVMGAMLVLILRIPKARRTGSSLLPRVAFMVAYSLFMGLRSSAINNIAHIGGLLCGALLCFLFTMTRNDINLEAFL